MEGLSQLIFEGYIFCAQAVRRPTELKVPNTVFKGFIIGANMGYSGLCMGKYQFRASVGKRSIWILVTLFQS